MKDSKNFIRCWVEVKEDATKEREKEEISYNYPIFYSILPNGEISFGCLKRNKDLKVRRRTRRLRIYLFFLSFRWIALLFLPSI